LEYASLSYSYLTVAMEGYVYRKLILIVLELANIATVTMDLLFKSRLALTWWC
jgi:hypothetical protein